MYQFGDLTRSLLRNLFGANQNSLSHTAATATPLEHSDHDAEHLSNASESLSGETTEPILPAPTHVRGYQLGDVTRGVAAAIWGYRFGDITRAVASTGAAAVNALQGASRQSTTRADDTLAHQTGNIRSTAFPFVDAAHTGCVILCEPVAGVWAASLAALTLGIVVFGGAAAMVVACFGGRRLVAAVRGACAGVEPRQVAASILIALIVWAAWATGLVSGARWAAVHFSHVIDSWAAMPDTVDPVAASR